MMVKCLLFLSCKINMILYPFLKLSDIVVSHFFVTVNTEKDNTSVCGRLYNGL